MPHLPGHVPEGRLSPGEIPTRQPEAAKKRTKVTTLAPAKRPTIQQRLRGVGAAFQQLGAGLALIEGKAGLAAGLTQLAERAQETDRVQRAQRQLGVVRRIQQLARTDPAAGRKLFAELETRNLEPEVAETIFAARTRMDEQEAVGLGISALAEGAPPKNPMEALTRMLNKTGPAGMDHLKSFVQVAGLVPEAADQLDPGSVVRLQQSKDHFAFLAEAARTGPTAYTQAIATLKTLGIDTAADGDGGIDLSKPDALAARQLGLKGVVTYDQLTGQNAADIQSIKAENETRQMLLELQQKYGLQMQFPAIMFPGMAGKTVYNKNTGKPDEGAPLGALATGTHKALSTTEVQAYNDLQAAQSNIDILLPVVSRLLAKGFPENLFRAGQIAFAQTVGGGTALTALFSLSGATALQLASAFNRGRPNDADREVVDRMFPKPTDIGRVGFLKLKAVEFMLEQRRRIMMGVDAIQAPAEVEELIELIEGQIEEEEGVSWN